MSATPSTAEETSASRRPSRRQSSGEAARRSVGVGDEQHAAREAGQLEQVVRADPRVRREHAGRRRGAGVLDAVREPVRAEDVPQGARRRSSSDAGCDQPRSATTTARRPRGRRSRARTRAPRRRRSRARPSRARRRSPAPRRAARTASSTSSSSASCFAGPAGLDDRRRLVGGRLERLVVADDRRRPRRRRRRRCRAAPARSPRRARSTARRRGHGRRARAAPACPVSSASASGASSSRLTSTIPAQPSPRPLPPRWTKRCPKTRRSTKTSVAPIEAAAELVPDEGTPTVWTSRRAATSA